MSLFGEGFLVLTFTDGLGFSTTITYELNIGDGVDRDAELADGMNKADAIVAAAKDVIDAGLTGAYFKWVDEGASPWADEAAGGGAIAQEARVSVYLDSPEPSTDKFWPMRIPSPIAAALDGQAVDLTNATLQAFVDALDAGAFVSDRETIDVAQGVNGMKLNSGRVIYRARK